MLNRFRNLDVALWLALFLGFSAVSIAGLVGWQGDAQLGVNGEPRGDGTLAITWVNPYGPVGDAPGGLPGDLLVRIDGQPITATSWAMSGDHGTRFLLFRPNTMQFISGPANGEGVIGLGNAVLLETIAIVFALVGTLVFLRSRRSLVITVFMAMCLVAGMAFAVAPASAQYRTWATVTQGVFLNWFVFLFVLLFLIFPRQRPFSGRLMATALPAFVLVTAGLSALHVWTIVDQPTWLTFAQRGQFIHIALGMLTGVVLVTDSYRRSRSPVEREQLRIMVVGTALAVLPFAVLAMLPEIVSVAPILSPQNAAFAIVLMPLAFAYSIKRHQLFGIRRLVHRGVAYSAISFVVVLLFAAFLVALNAAGERDIASNAIIQAILLTLLFAGATLLSGTRRLALHTVDRVL